MDSQSSLVYVGETHDANKQAGASLARSASSWQLTNDVVTVMVIYIYIYIYIYSKPYY